jgi:hypothetical protein
MIAEISPSAFMHYGKNKNEYDVQNQDKHAFILRNNAVWSATRLYGMLLEEIIQ